MFRVFVLLLNLLFLVSLVLAIFGLLNISIPSSLAPYVFVSFSIFACIAGIFYIYDALREKQKGLFAGGVAYLLAGILGYFLINLWVYVAAYLIALAFNRLDINDPD